MKPSYIRLAGAAEASITSRGWTPGCEALLIALLPLLPLQPFRRAGLTAGAVK